MSSRPSASNVLGLLGAFVVTSMVAGVLAAGLAIPAVGASGLATKDGVNFFESLPADLAQPPLSEQSTLLDADGHKITTFYDEYRVEKPLNKISPFMQQAIVAIEDARFYQHSGIDPKGLLRAAIVNQIHHTAAQGASTLTQQYVKNVLAESAHAVGDEQAQIDATKKDSGRKLKEIRLAVSLEKTMGKPEILDKYLNIAWFGGQINGVEAASQYYFHTSAKKLTLPQAATLAGMIQSPVDYSPKNHAKASRSRRNVVLDKMLAQKMIDQPTHDAAVASKLGQHITPNLQGCANASYEAYFCGYVYSLLTKDPAFSALGKTEADRQTMLLRGGLTIKTTMDPSIEKAAWKATTSQIAPSDKAAAASVTVQAGTGKVLSIQQNKYYGSGSTSKTNVNYSVDQQYGGSNGFQTGSTFKPFTLATWLKAGKSLNAVVDGTPGVVPLRDFKACQGEPLNNVGTYTVHNSADGEGQGPMTVWNATAASINGAYINMEKQLNLCDIRSTAEDLGVHLGGPQSDQCVYKNPPMTTRLPICIASLTLGPKEIAPMTMAAAYAAFASGGTYCAPIAVTSITDRNGKPLKIPGQNCKRALDPKVANTVNLGLSHIFASNGTGYGLGGLPGRPSSGKTGTTNKSIDTWFVGYTPQMATSVWVGDPTIYKQGDPVIYGLGKPGRKSMNNRTLNGHAHNHIFGATVAGPIWKSIMTAAMDGLPVEQFGPADPHLTRAANLKVPNVAGMSVSDATKALQKAGYKVQTTNQMVGSQYPVGSVAATNPAAGTSAPIGTTIGLIISSGGGVPGNNGGNNNGQNNGGQNNGNNGGGNNNNNGGNNNGGGNGGPAR